MEINYNIFIKKSKKMLSTIKKEYEFIIKNYNEKAILKKSYTIKAKKNISLSEKKYINAVIKQFFDPTLKQISLLIDNGLLAWDSAIEEIDLKDIQNNDKKVEDLLYESWEKLYIYKTIKYNLIMSFIMQIYLYIEKELSVFLFSKYKNKNLSTFFSCIDILEKEGKHIDKCIKEKIDLYRNIINVYKHGKGTSFDELQKKYPQILNIHTETTDLSFIFNLKFISFEDIYNTLYQFIEELY